ncbi:MAG: hypothetical protein IT436_15895 [Phycisphaerales bacterium]|nr:hypothetical protein [Phycisphaerales bacterium]
MIIDDFLIPAVAVSLVSVIIQGVKVVWDAVAFVVGRRVTIQQRDIAYYVAMASLIDALPLSVGERLVAKQQLAQKQLTGMKSADIKDLLARVVTDSEGEPVAGSRLYRSE